MKSNKITYQYAKNVSTLFYSCTDQQNKEIQNIKKNVDKASKQITLKFTIFETHNLDTDEKGVRFASLYNDASGVAQIALDTILVPFSSRSPVLQSVDFFAALRLLHKHNLIYVKQFPYVLAKDKKEFIFEAVNNIPYLVSTTAIESANTSSQVNYEYKDIGLKIKGILDIYDNHSDLDLQLTIEDLVSFESDQNGNPLPVTTKRFLDSSSTLEYGKVLILSGINQTKEEKKSVSLPFLSDIPYLGNLFKYNYVTKEDRLLSIAIQLVYPNDIEIDKASFLPNELANEQKKDAVP